MAKKSPQAVAAKWQRGMSGAGQAIRDGVMAVTTNPADRAIAQKAAWVDGVQRAASNGKWERGLRRVSLPDWQKAMIDKGLNRIGTGATAAQPKVERFMTAWLSHMDALASKLSSMPRGTPEQNIERMLVAVRHNMDFKYT